MEFLRRRLDLAFYPICPDAWYTLIPYSSPHIDSGIVDLSSNYIHPFYPFLIFITLNFKRRRDLLNAIIIILLNSHRV